MTVLSEPRSGPLAGLRPIAPAALGPALLAAGLLVAAVAYLGPALAAVAVGGPLALAAAVLLSARPAVVLPIMVVVEVSNATNVLEPHVPRVFHASLALGLLTLARLLVTSAEARRALWPFLPVTAGLLGVYLLGQLLAALGGERPATSAEVLARSAVDALFVLVLVALALAVGRPWALAAAVAGTLAGLAALGVLNELAFHGSATFGGFATVSDASGELTTTARHAGPLPDSNFWGRHLVLGLPLAAALLTRAVRAGRRPAATGWAVAMLALLGSVYLTQSRGTFVAAGVALVCWLAAGGRAVRRRALPVLALGLPALLLPGIGDRFAALLTDLTDPAAGYAADPSVLGRSAAQEIAWAMFQGKPVLGVGPGAYTELVPQFAGTVATAVLTPTDAPHNLYLQVAAESGVVGLAAWLLMFGGFTALAGWATARLARAGGPAGGDRPLAAAALAGLLAWAAASVFLHLAYFRTVGVVLALVVAVAARAGTVTARAGAVAARAGAVAARAGAVAARAGAVAARAGAVAARAGAVAARAGAAEVTGPRPLPARTRRLLVAAPLAVLAGTGGLLLALAHTGQPATTADRLVTLAPTVDPYAWNAYSYDVRSRIDVLPTYAALAVDPRQDAVTAQPDPVRGVVRISARAADEATARQRLDAALAEAGARIRGFGADRAYTLAPVGTVELRASRQRPAADWLLVAGAAAGAAALAAAAVLLAGRLPVPVPRPPTRETHR